jgi:hypothetical protein
MATFGVSLLLSAEIFAAPIQPGRNDVINPIGEETLGQLIVDAPPIPTGAGSCSFTVEAIGGSASNAGRAYALAMGTPVRAVEGQYTISVRGNCGSPVSYHNLSSVQVIRRQTTRYPLAALRLQIDRSVLDVDIAPRPLVQVQLGIEAPITWEALNEYMVVAPGLYKVTYGVNLLRPLSIDLLPGEVKLVDMTPPDRRVTLTIANPQRQFVNVRPSSCSTQRTWVVFRHSRPYYRDNFFLFEPLPDVQSDLRNTLQGITEAVAIEPTGSKTIRYFSVESSTGHAPFPRHEVVVNNMAEVLSPVRTGNATFIQLKRIDVNDVNVVREDGSSYIRSGLFSVWKRDFPSYETDYNPSVKLPNYSRENCAELPSIIPTTNFATLSGVDVLPGRYRIEVKYDTEEGRKTQIHDLDLR